MQPGYFGLPVISILTMSAIPLSPIKIRWKYNDDLASNPLDQTLKKERLTALRQLLLQLSETDQELLRLRYVAELSFSDIAILFGKKQDAVKKGLYRLVARLQSQLEENG